MQLDKMSRAELAQYSILLEVLIRAADLFDDAGFDPIVDLTPGRAVTISLPAPSLFAIEDVPREFEYQQAVQQIADSEAALRHLCVSHGAPDDVLCLHWLDAQLAARPGKDAPDFAAPIAAPQFSPVQRQSPFNGPSGEKGGAAGVVAALPPAAPVEQVKAELMPLPKKPAAPASIKPVAAGPMVATVWTEARNQRLLAMLVQAHTEGQTKVSVFKLAAVEFGTSAPAVEQHFKRNLRRTFEGMIATAPQPGVMDASAPVAAPVAVPPPPAPAFAPPVAKSSAVAAPKLAVDVTSHVCALSYDRIFTLQVDIDILSLACLGWKLPEIAVDMDLDAGVVQRRFDLLTGLYRDASGKPVRRFAREDVLTALKDRAALSGVGLKAAG